MFKRRFADVFDYVINNQWIYDKGSAAPSDSFNYIGFRLVLVEDKN